MARTDSELFTEAIHLAETGDYRAAHAEIKQLLDQNDEHLDGWLALVELAENEQERRQAIYKAWSLDPSHPDTNFLLDRLKAGTLPPLQHAPDLRKSKHTDDGTSHILSSMNYYPRAIITLVLYTFTVFPGLFANLYWLFDSFKRERATGMKQQGVGCLWLQLVLLGLPTLLIGGVLIFAIGSALLLIAIELFTGVA